MSAPSTICGKCMHGKQVKQSRENIVDINTSRLLDLITSGPFGPMRTKSIGGKKYVLVIVDDFARFTFVILYRKGRDNNSLKSHLY